MMDSELDEHRLTPCRKRVTKSNVYDVPINREEEPIEVSRKTVTKTWFFNDILNRPIERIKVRSIENTLSTSKVPSSNTPKQKADWIPVHDDIAVLDIIKAIDNTQANTPIKSIKELLTKKPLGLCIWVSELINKFKPCEMLKFMLDSMTRKCQRILLRVINAMPVYLRQFACLNRLRPPELPEM